MERQAVNSSNIAAIGYDAVTQVLEVEFRNGGIFQYQGVQQDYYVKLMGAASIGWFLHKNIKGKFKCEKVGDIEG